MKSSKKCENITIISYNLMGDILKKIFESIGLLSLICFGFFYTEKISTVLKDNDDILKQIKQIENQYKVDAIDAIVEGNTIIPGVSGSVIDVNKSYKKMKKINSFNDNLIVYKTIKPNISVNKVYDKYIISGNKNKKEVALIFLVNDKDNISDIISILDEKEVLTTFFTDGYWFENNNDLVLELIDRGHIIGNLGYLNKYSNDTTKWMNTIIKRVGNQENTYCYNIDSDENLKVCNDNNSYTIRPNLIVKNNPLIEVKNNLNNGSIIALDINDITIKQLPLILDYIDSKGLDLITLENLIDE